MTNFLSVTDIISILALAVSAFTAYRTFRPKFVGNIFLKPYIVLTKYNNEPSILLGFDIANTGEKSGSIEDIVLMMKYDRPNNSTSIYYFSPIFITKEYNIGKTYQNTDIEPFSSISLSSHSRFSNYILFKPSGEGFTPSEGYYEMNVYYRTSSDDTWISKKDYTNIPINSESLAKWKNIQGESVLIETSDHLGYRDKLIKQLLKQAK